MLYLLGLHQGFGGLLIYIFDFLVLVFDDFGQIGGMLVVVFYLLDHQKFLLFNFVDFSLQSFLNLENLTGLSLRFKHLPCMGVLLILKLLPGVEHLQFHLLASVHGPLILFDPLFILVLYLLLLFLPGYLHLLITNPDQILLGFFRLLLQFLKLFGQMSHLSRMLLALIHLLVLNNQQFLFPLDSHKFLGLFNLFLQFFVVSVGYGLIFIFFPDQLILFTFNFTTQFLYLRCVFI